MRSKCWVVNLPSFAFALWFCRWAVICDKWQASSVLPNIIRPSIALDAASILFVVTSVSKSGVAVTHDVQPAVAAAAAMIHDEGSEAIVPTTIVRRSSFVSLIHMSQDFLVAFSWHALPSTAAPTSTDHGVVKHIWWSIYFPCKWSDSMPLATASSAANVASSLSFGVRWYVIKTLAKEYVSGRKSLAIILARMNSVSTCITCWNDAPVFRNKSWTSCCHPQFSPQHWQHDPHPAHGIMSQELSCRLLHLDLSLCCAGEMYRNLIERKIAWYQLAIVVVIFFQTIFIATLLDVTTSTNHSVSVGLSYQKLLTDQWFQLLLCELILHR